MALSGRQSNRNVERAMTTYSVLKVTLEDRVDGGLRVYSEDLPGLILSGRNKKTVCEGIAPSIKALLEHNGIRVLSVAPSQPIHEVIHQPSPRDLDMHVQHVFVVVLSNSNAYQQVAV